jgi:hypothetical protein
VLRQQPRDGLQYADLICTAGARARQDEGFAGPFRHSPA